MREVKNYGIPRTSTGNDLLKLLAGHHRPRYENSEWVALNFACWRTPIANAFGSAVILLSERNKIISWLRTKRREDLEEYLISWISPFGQSDDCLFCSTWSSTQWRVHTIKLLYKFRYNSKKVKLKQLKFHIIVRVYVKIGPHIDVWLDEICHMVAI